METISFVNIRIIIAKVKNKGIQYLNFVPEMYNYVRLNFSIYLSI